ncbi:MAG: lytic murein transglycosylase [Actinomycetota bacterium]
MRPNLPAVDVVAAATVSPLTLPPVTRVAFRAALARELSRRSRAVLGAVLATVLAAALLVANRTPAARAESIRAKAVAPSPVPSPAPAPATPAHRYGALARQAAATCPGLPAGVLYAIAQTETRHGVDTAVSTAGAVGPMQFLPATWKAYAIDGDGDGRALMGSPADAVHTAANHLCANGGADPRRLRDAIWNYNHSDAYVDEVLRIAGSYSP